MVIAENEKKKRVKMKTEKQSYEVLVYKDRLKLSLDPPTTSHIIILMLFLFAVILYYAAIIKN
jgi:hypothetical protein